jgi:hypothetical protein
MAKSLRIKGATGFTSISGKPCFTASGSKVFHFRESGASAEKLGAMDSGDRSDFIRAAIAEKLERDSSNQENCLREG